MSTTPGSKEDRRQIFAMGGGGFTMEPANPLLDDFVLSLPGTAEPKILFLATASGETSAHLNAFRERFAHRTCVASDLSLFRLSETTRTLEEVVLEQDIVYVGGGSMRNLLALWRAHGLERILMRAWEAGTVLAGLSAGAMCWFQAGVTRSRGAPETLGGLGLLDGSLSVHADGEPERLPVWLTAVRDGAIPGGWALDDGVGLLFRGRTLGAGRELPPRRRGRAGGRGRGRAGAAPDPARAAARGLLGGGARRAGRGGRGAATGAPHATADGTSGILSDRGDGGAYHG